MWFFFLLLPLPLQYKQIPPLIAEKNATIFLSTDTFLRGYAMQATKEELAGLRLVVAGAERLKPQTSALYKEKYGITILQGYGVTETSPVASVNLPEANADGSVGKLLPGMEHKLLWKALRKARRTKRPECDAWLYEGRQPGEPQPAGEWYDTGDG